MAESRLALQMAEALGFGPAREAGPNIGLSESTFVERFSYAFIGGRLARLHLAGRLERNEPSSIGSVMLFLVQDGRLVLDAGPTMSSGDVGLIDGAGEIRGQAFNLEVLTLMSERQTISAPLDVQEVGLLKGGEPAVKLLESWIFTLFDSHADLADEDIDVALKAVMDLAGKIVRQKTAEKFIHRSVVDAASLVRSFINDNITDSNLSPGKIAGAMQLSRSRLYQLFAMDGGVEAYITKRRLDLCLVEFSTLPPATRGVGQIAARHGFKSGAHFNRAFRKRFAAAPSAFFGIGALQGAEIAAQAEARRLSSLVPKLDS